MDSSQNTDHTTDYSDAILNKSHHGQQQTTEEIVAIVFQDQLTKDQTESAYKDEDPSLQQRWSNMDFPILN